MNTRTSSPRKSHWVRGTLWIILVLLIVFFGGGGWYFSDQLKADAFQVKPYEREYRATVAAIDSESIRILQGDPADGELFNPGRLGLVWQGGFGTVDEITSETVSAATRSFELLGGEPPVIGTEVDVDHWMYPDDYAAALGLELRDVDYTSPLGTMDAVLIPGRTDTWAILVHGKDANPRETMRLGAILSETGVSVLAIAHRNDIGQPGDPSGYHRYGVTEWEDLEGAVDYSLSQGADRVILGSFSTGGAIVLSFLEHSDRADRISSVILDSPNIDFGATVDHVAARRKIPLIGLPVPPPLTWVAKTIGSFRFGVDWGEIDYIDRSESLEVPILILHGVEDPSVPIETSRELAARQPDLVTLVEFEGAKHIQSWNADPERYREAVLDFLARVVRTQTIRHAQRGLAYLDLLGAGSRLMGSFTGSVRRVGRCRRRLGSGATRSGSILILRSGSPISPMGR